MLPIRFTSWGFARLLAGLALPLVLTALVTRESRSRELPPLGVEDMRALLAPRRDTFGRKVDTVAELTELRRNLRETAARLPSLGEVSRVLLLTEWGTSELESETTVPLKKIEEVVKEPDDKAFQSKVRAMFRSAPEDTPRIRRAITDEIKRQMRLQLLARLETRSRHYLHSSRDAERIASANLLTDTLEKSRRQDLSALGMFLKGPKAVSTSRYLRRRLHNLQGDLHQLLRDPDPRVQAAAIRTLSNLESDPAGLVEALKPMTAASNDVLVRRAVAEGFSTALDAIATQWDREKSRPQPAVRAVEELLPGAVLCLPDTDLQVRRSSLTACARAALLLDEVARSGPQETKERNVLFRPALAAVNRSLPALSERARDSVPEVRVAACRVLEGFALAARKILRPGDFPVLPPAPPLPGFPELELEKKPEGKRGVSLPAPRGSQHGRASRPGQWARDRLPSALAQPRSAKASGGAADTRAPIVTLDTPVRLPDALPTIRPVSYVARRLDDLPRPKEVEDAIPLKLDAILKDLRDPDYRVRLAAVDLLETLREQAEPAIPDLVKSLRDRDKFVRWGTARTLGKLAPRQAKIVVPGLMALLNDREDPSVRIMAADALRRYGPAAKDAVRLLARVINRGDKDYVLAVLQAIQGIGTDAVEALPNVAWLLRDRSQPVVVRVEAAQTLGRFGTLAKDQLPTLRAIMTSDPEEAVRNAASTAVLAVDRPLK
jgi:HEAT repeat protein